MIRIEISKRQRRIGALSPKHLTHIAFAFVPPIKLAFKRSIVVCGGASADKPSFGSNDGSWTEMA